MLLQHELKTSVCTDFSSSLELSQTSDFYNSTETWMMLCKISISKHIPNMFMSRRELSLLSPLLVSTARQQILCFYAFFYQSINE